MGLFSKKQPAPVIDLPAEEARTAPFLFGYPTRCPACGERGYLDHIDPFKKVQYEHCPACFARWELGEVDIQALNA
jgi:uncharacterized protein (DUF983 family)